MHPPFSWSSTRTTYELRQVDLSTRSPKCLAIVRRRRRNVLSCPGTDHGNHLIVLKSPKTKIGQACIQEVPWLVSVTAGSLCPNDHEPFISRSDKLEDPEEACGRRRCGWRRREPFRQSKITVDRLGYGAISYFISSLGELLVDDNVRTHLIHRSTSSWDGKMLWQCWKMTKRVIMGRQWKRIWVLLLVLIVRKPTS